MSSSSSTGDRPVAGALYILSSSFMFAVVGSLVRLASESLPNEVVVFFRNSLVLLFLLPFFMVRKTLPVIRTGKAHLHILRASAGLAAMYCYFYSLGRMKLGEAVLLSYVSPVFIPIIALIWLKEPMTREIRRAIAIGLAGVVFILKPGLSIFQPVALVALSASVFASLAMVSIRRMSETEGPATIVFFYTLLSTVISAVPLLWAWQNPGRDTYVVLMLLGFAATVAQLLMTKGYGLAPAGQVGPFIYGSVVFASLIGWVFWGEALDMFSIAGACLVFLAGFIATRAGKS